MSESIIFNKKEKVAVLKLNRPTVFNSINKEMALRFQELLDQCKEDKEIRAVYISGEGKAFCAGQDLAEITKPGAKIESIVGDLYNPIIERIRNLEKPVVCAVNGVAAGAGANIALSGDIVVATASASFIQAFSKIGLIPDSGGTFFLPRLVGFQKASALMMLGDKIAAADAEKMGMVYKVFEDEIFPNASFELAKTLANMPTRGLALTKELLNTSMTNNLTAQLAMEEKMQAKAGKTNDYKEGVQAFIEKRKPNFTGS